MKLKICIAGLIAAIFPLLSLAHEGHGTWAGQAHEFEHLAWLLAGLIAGVVLLVEGYRRFGARSERHDDQD